MSWLAAVAARWKALEWRADLVVALLAGVGYAILGWTLWEGSPTGIDEITSLWQAGNLLHGRLAGVMPAYPEAVITRFTGMGPGGHIGQFSLGTAMALAPFVASGLIWLTGPVWGALAVFLWARLVRHLEADAPTALAAVLLLALSAFWALQATSQMAHVPITACIFAIGLALARVLRARDGSRAALVLGVLVGVGALIRPVEALAAAVPAALIILWRVARGQLAGRTIVLGLVGVAGPLALLLASNAQITGAPLRFGYDVVWGPKHSIGFHETPAGEQFTPKAGATKILTQWRHLGTTAWESRLSALIPAAIGLLLSLAAITLLEGWALLTVLGITIGYWAFWANAEWFGPRFVLPLLPFVMLYVARVPRLLARLTPRLGVAAALVIVAAMVQGAVERLPRVWGKYDGYERSLTRDLRPVLAAAPTPGLIIARGSFKRANEARLRRFAGNAATVNAMMKQTNQCDILWMLRWRELGVEAVPPVAKAWRSWCAGPDYRQWQLVSSDPTGAILLYATPERPVVRDLGARTALLADSATFQDRTSLLIWDRVGLSSWRPRLERFNYDSARVSWALEDSAFAQGRRETGR